MTFTAPSKALAYLDRLAQWKRGNHPAPVTVEFDLSNRCSLGCQSCHFAHTHTRGPWAGKDRALPQAFSQPGDLANTAMVKRALIDLAAFGVKGVVWSGGGEPTLHPDWQEIMTFAQECGLKQGMYTLGGHFSWTTAQMASDLLTWVVVSLDAVTADDYAKEKGVDPQRFDAACEGIAWLSMSKKAHVSVSYLLHADNWEKVGSMVMLARRLGAHGTTLRPTIETSPDDPATITGDRSWVDEALPLLATASANKDVECDLGRFRAYRDWGPRSYHTCHAIKMHATITPDGRVWVCPQRRGVIGSSIGDLNTQSFADMWGTHNGAWTDFSECRAMCRLHLLNEQIAPVFEDYKHVEFL